MRTSILGALVVASAVAVGCASVEPSRPAPVVQATPAIPREREASPPFGAFVRRRSFVPAERVRLDGEASLAWLEGFRVAFDAAGRPTGAVEGPAGGRGVVEVPEALGGGYAIYGSTGLYVADGPLGAARRVAPLDVTQVSFGPRGALVELVDGRRRVVDLRSGAVGAVQPVGAASMVVSGPRLAAALLEGGRVVVTRDGGASWLATPEHPRRFADLRVDVPGGAPVVIDDLGAAFRLDDRALTQIPLPQTPPATPPFDARWIGAEDPLDAAVQRGAAWGDDRVIVAVRGTLFVLRASSGEVLEVEAGVLPPNRPCTAIGLTSEVLFACAEEGRTSITRRPRGGGAATVEITFAGTGHLVRGGGEALLYTGTCEGDATKAGRACVRKKGGTWAPIDRSALFDTAPAGPILAWVPTDSSAMAILGGESAGVLDAATGERSVLDKAASQRIASLVNPRSDLVEHRFAVRAGEIEGWSTSGEHVRLARRGASIEVSPFKVSGARIAGPRALASGPDDTLWQSTDWGRTFTQVPTPPVRVGSPSACGEVGCTFGAWIRRGWPEDRAQPRRRESVSAPAMTLPVAPLPRLRCVVSGPQSTKIAPGREGAAFTLGAEIARAGEPLTVFALGPDDPQGHLDAVEGVRAVASGPAARDPDAALDPGEVLSVRHTAPFDADATVQRVTFKAAELIEASRRAGAARPTRSELEGEGNALAVLAPRGSPDETLLVRGSIQVATWLRGRSTLSFATQQENADLGTLTGAARSGDALFVLTSDGDGGAHVLRVEPGHLERSFDVPARRGPGPKHHTLDALGIDADGAPSLVRVAGRTPPDAEDPAVKIDREGRLTPLAAWRTLTADGGPGCEGADGVRVLVHAQPSWIQLGADPPTSGHMAARVRWSASRVCLEAVEITNATHDVPSGRAESLMVATFGAKPKSGLVLVDRGVELREPRRCELEGGNSKSK